MPLVDELDQVGAVRSGYGVYGTVIRTYDGLPCYECGSWWRSLARIVHEKRA